MTGVSTYAAVAAVLRTIAADPSNPVAVPQHNGSPIKLPGRESPDVQALEREIAALVLRVRQLETRANSASATQFPDTPNEKADSLFGDDTASSPSSTGRGSIKSRLSSGLSRNGAPPDDRAAKVNLTDEALAGLREHVDDQSKLLDTQRQELAGVNAQLLEQKQLQEKALAIMEQERVATLERELWKHQKANEAFQKALREIGEIVTAVARGDLSKKVRMNTVEMDPEITTFKRTINTMMDQLQVFSSEVSRVAREVGTEGILGGQAQIEGVDGTWKELTDNGKLPLRVDSCVARLLR